MNNKRNILLAFGALAIVLVAVLAIWRPPALRTEDASGAIGSVQKHRAPQIAQKDVILGDEAAKEEQNVLFGDFLDDSAKLQGISNTVNAMAANRLDNQQVQAASKSLADFSDQLQARYAQRLAALVSAANKAAAKSNDAKLASEVAELGTRLNAKLSAKDMDEMNAKLALIIVVCQKLQADSVDLAQRKMAEALVALQSRQAPEAAAKLAAVTAELNSRASGPSFAQMGDYLQAIAMESKVAAAAQAKLAALAESKMANRLASEISVELGKQAIELQSRAIANMQARTANQSEMAQRLAAIEGQIDAANKVAANEASVMAAKADNISASLAGVRGALAARNAEFAARTASAIELELGALNAYQLGPSMLGLDSKLAARESAEHRLGPAIFGLDAKLAARAAANRIDMANHIMAVRNLAAKPSLAARVNSKVLNDAAELQQRLAAKAN